VTAGTVELLALELAKVLEPLESALTSGEILQLFSDLGLELPPVLASQPGFADALSSAAAGVEQLTPLAAQLAAAIEAEDAGRIVQLAVQIIGIFTTLVPAIETIATELANVAGSLPGVDPNDVTDFAADLAVRLLDYSVTGYLRDYRPILLQILALLGIVEIVHDSGVPGDPTKPPHVKRNLRLEKIADLLGDPEAHLRATYGWGDATFDGPLLLERIHDVLASLSAPVVYDAAATPPTLRLMLFRVRARPDLAPPGLEAALDVSLPAHIDVSVPVISPEWLLGLTVDGELQADAALTIQPPADLKIVPPSGSIEGRTSLGLSRLPKAPATTITLLSIVGGSRLEAAEIGAAIVAELRWESSPTPHATADFGFEGQIRGGKLTVTMDEADGFLKTLLAGFRIESGFDLGFGWTAGRGVYFTGSSTLEIQLPAHIALGPIEINALTLGIGLRGAQLPITLGADIKGELGPLQVVVQQIGLEADLSFPPNRDGNLGPAQLDFKFKPPTGAGLAIDAGVVKGGGYLFFDPDHEQYAGVLELDISGIVTVKAIGLITTRLPDGSSGFSLLIIITAEFGTGIQLGFGFTLIGVGGLLGLNRTMRLQPLMEGVRSGSINSIMFPHDVVANAPRIISDLQAIFPPKRDTFLIGPMAKLGWGTPTLVSLAIGVIVEIPGNIAILGVLKIALPTEDAVLIQLQVNFAGAIEFDKKRLYFFASLFESRILFMTIEGEMAVVAAFGDDATFVLSVGGFHPSFNPPPLPVPSPRRISISILNEPQARLRVEGYFAVTTNTAQFGARVEAFFGVSAFNVEGSLGFDALFQFSPFHFVITISASFGVHVFGIGAFGIHAQFSLEGPSPWRAHGTGTISLLFFDIDVAFDVTWGEERDTMLPPIVVMPMLKAEFEKPANWNAILPAGNSILVSLRPLDPAASELVLHPVGTLRLSQRAVPLDLPIDKIGTQKPSDAKRFSLSVTGGGLAKRADVIESFAPAQFQDFPDSAKLSKPAYEPDHGGIELSAAGAQLDSGVLVKRIVRYELITIDTNFRRFLKPFFGFSGVLFAHLLDGASIARSPLSRFEQKRRQPFDDKVDARPETFVVASQADNRAVHAEAFASESMARDFLAQRVAADPTQDGSLHVIPSFERAA
jgi:hypothetical protein